MRSAIDSSTRRSSSLSPAKRIAASKPGNLPRRKRTCRTPQPRLRRRLIQGGSFYPKPGGSITRNRAANCAVCIATARKSTSEAPVPLELEFIVDLELGFHLHLLLAEYCSPNFTAP